MNYDKASWVAGYLLGTCQDHVATQTEAENAYELRMEYPTCAAMSVSMSGVPLLCDLEPGHRCRHMMLSGDGTPVLEWHE